MEEMTRIIGNEINVSLFAANEYYENNLAQSKSAKFKKFVLGLEVIDTLDFYKVVTDWVVDTEIKSGADPLQFPMI